MDSECDRKLIERQIDSEAIFDGALLHVKRDRVRLPDGSTATREYIVHPGAVMIIPRLPDVLTGEKSTIKKSPLYMSMREAWERFAAVLVAKSVASIAVMTQGRFGFGVGLSPWPEDFVVTGTDWKTRGKRMDEMIAIVRGLLRGGYFEFEGTHYRVPRIKICPVPPAPVPILIGGHTEPALRRAARLGDGWMHAGGDHELLAQRVECRGGRRHPRRTRRGRRSAGLVRMRDLLGRCVTCSGTGRRRSRRRRRSPPSGARAP